MCTHLAKRGSRYYFRRKIPLDLLPHYKGREVMRSLGTSDRREAERLARIVGVELDREFERLRAPHLLNSTDLQNARHSAQATLPADTADSQEPGLLCADIVQRHLSQQEGVRNGLQEVLTGVGSAGIAGTWAARQAQQGQPKAAVALKGKTSFDVLIDKWALGIQPEQNTISRTRMHARRFEEMAGVHTVEEVTRQHAIRFIERLQQVGQTPQNINMHLASLIKLLNYAVRLDLVKTNEASGLTVKAPSGEKARRSFDLPALKSIFGSPVYTAGHRPRGGGGEASYWLPLLALFTGARLEELCQLHPDDVMQVAYHDEGSEASAWVIRITDEGEGQGLKNAGSRRRVPLHPELERLGFVDYVQQAKYEGHKRIFHNLVPSIDGKEGGNFSKWFGRYLRDGCKVADKRMVFHSFRHLFKEVLREAEIPKEINDALTGHESGDVGDKYGGDAYPIRPLVKAIKRYRVSGLTLPAPWKSRGHAG
jgi:integrase